ncbi:MAG TPA: cysteine dioxygenase family protein, partial [Gammaproteobacteria bacterium]|nr:cysteine dioxygenase family protein [Gammaproteobacteria bacterium]
MSTDNTKLINMLDMAVQQPDTKAVTSAIKHGLQQLLRDNDLHLPDCVQDKAEGHYARRLIYRSEEHGYSVIAMTWGPDQATPLHDHAGLWCVEAVCDGKISVTQYELVEQQGERFRFEKAGNIEEGAGAAGSLIPPHEYHTIANCCGSDCAVTLHIYGGDMDECHMFKPEGN